MLHFAKWTKIVIVLTCVLGVIFSLPNLIPAATLDKLPSWLPKHQVNLGLDLRGGSHLLLEVDYAKALHDLLENVVDNARTALRKANLGYTGLDVKDDTVVVQLRDYDKLKQEGREAEIQKLFRDLDPELVSTISDTGLVTLRYSETALTARRRAAVDQSIEIVRRRIDETGVREPTIEREGQDRILVQLPGIDNPEHVKAILGQTAKMTFQLVDTNTSVEEAQHGHLPPGDEILPAAEGRRPGQPSAYVVQKRVMVSGDTLVDAQPTFQNNEPVVSFKFDAAGGRRFAEATEKNVGRPFAIVLDNKVISAPVIREPILGGSGVISGSFTVQSANDLAILLRAGALPAPLTVIEERTVGPGLGQDSINAGEHAAYVGAGLVVVFMLVTYGLFGLFANIAVAVNVAMIFGVLSMLNATLTLPGIAGIVLTVGIAVDSNVLIYERIREEVRAGRTAINAIDAGFSRALATILDSNITTFIAAAVLFYIGTGPVRGFAVTLGIGILTSLFTAFTMTRLIVAYWVRLWRPRAVPI